MMLQPLPESMHAPLTNYERAHLPALVAHLPKHMALPWFIHACGWHVGYTQRAATALAALHLAHVPVLRAARLVAYQLREEVRDAYDREQAALSGMQDYPSAADHERINALLALAHRMSLLYNWIPA